MHSAQCTAHSAGYTVNGPDTKLDPIPSCPLLHHLASDLHQYHHSCDDFSHKRSFFLSSFKITNLTRCQCLFNSQPTNVTGEQCHWPDYKNISSSSKDHHQTWPWWLFSWSSALFDIINTAKSWMSIPCQFTMYRNHLKAVFLISYCFMTTYNHHPHQH